MKKYLFWLLGIAFAGIGMFGVSFADTAATTDKGLTLKDEWVKGIGVAGTKGNPDPNASQEPQLLKIIKNTINIVLGFLGLITLILLLRGGFQMVTANGDDKKFGTGQTVLKQAAMGLWFIAISWFLVSAIFWFINSAVKGWTWA